MQAGAQHRVRDAACSDPRARSPSAPPTQTCAVHQLVPLDAARAHSTNKMCMHLSRHGVHTQQGAACRDAGAGGITATKCVSECELVPMGAARGVYFLFVILPFCLCVLSVLFITRVAPHCVNTLRILHAAYDATMETCPLVNTPSVR